MVEGKNPIVDEWVTGKKKKTRILILILLISIIIVSLYFITTYEKHPSTPEAVAMAYAERISDNDIEGAFRMTTLSHTNMFDDYVDEAGDWAYHISFTYNDMEVMDPSNISSDEISYWESQSFQMETDWDVEIQNWVILDFDIIIESDTGDIENSHGRLACFKIDSKWYLHIPFE